MGGGGTSFYNYGHCWNCNVIFEISSSWKFKFSRKFSRKLSNFSRKSHQYFCFFKNNFCRRRYFFQATACICSSFTHILGKLLWKQIFSGTFLKKTNIFAKTNISCEHLPKSHVINIFSHVSFVSHVPDRFCFFVVNLKTSHHLPKSHAIRIFHQMVFFIQYFADKFFL